jgi:hypothetical protein
MRENVEASGSQGLKDRTEWQFDGDNLEDRIYITNNTKSDALTYKFSKIHGKPISKENFDEKSVYFTACQFDVTTTQPAAAPAADPAAPAPAGGTTPSAPTVSATVAKSAKLELKFDSEASEPQPPGGGTTPPVTPAVSKACEACANALQCKACLDQMMIRQIFGLGDAKYDIGATISVPVDTTVMLSASQEQIKQMIITEAQRQGVPVGIAIGVAWVESKFNATATSPVGCKGVMQLCDGDEVCKREGGITAAEYDKIQNGDIPSNIKCGIWYLNYLKKSNCNSLNYCSGADARTYSGWACATRSYNGKSCTAQYADKCYVSKVKRGAEQFGYANDSPLIVCPAPGESPKACNEFKTTPGAGQRFC